VRWPTAVGPTTEPTTTSGPVDQEPDLAAPFRDEFDGVLLSEARWAWLNEDPDGWRIDDGRLVITAGRLPAETTDR
jgi:hypothetical protein